MVRKRLHIHFCVALILCVLLASCSQKPQFQSPTLLIEPDKADFGEIQANDPDAFHDVSLKAKNLGREALRIENVELPDGFSYVLAPPKVIDGGAEAILKISMDARSFSGSISQTAYVVSNDPSKRRTPIQIQARIVEGTENPALEASSEPDIIFDHKAVDFGTVSRGKRFEHRFPFKNAGKKPLKILGLDTMCMCVTAFASSLEVPPGGSAEIVARFEPYKYVGTKPWKTVNVTTNDPVKPIVGLSVAATIVDVLTLEPDVVLLPAVQAGQGAVAEAKLYQGGTEKLRINKIDTSSPKISVTSSPLEGDELGYLLKVTVSPDMPPGKFEELVTIFTNYEDYSSLQTEKTAEVFKDYSRMKLPVKGSVGGAISASPQKVNFGTCVPGTPVQRKITVAGTSSSFDIESLSIKDPSFHASSTTIEKGKKYEVTIEFVPTPPDKQIEDELVIATTGAKLTVPIFATVGHGA